MKIWIALVCVYFLGVSAQSDEAGLPDYWADDYDDQWYQDELEKLGIVSNENKDAPEDTNDANDNVGNQEQAEDKMDEESIKADDTVNDYQVEDNRSEQKIEDIAELEEKASLIRDFDDANNMNAYDDYDGDIDDNNDEAAVETDAKEEVKYSKDDEIVPLPLPPQSSDEIKVILEETKDILDQEEQQPNEFAQDSAQTNEDQDLSGIIDETKKILSETNDQFDEDPKSEQIDKPEQQTPEKESVQDNEDEEDKNIDENEEDSLDKAYEDLNEDLDTLFETLQKLANSEDVEDKVEPDVDYAVNSDESLDEKTDYENVFDSNLSDLFAEHSKTVEEAKEIPEEKVGESELADEEENLPEEKIQESESVDVAVSIDVEENKLPYVNDALVSDDKDEKSDEKPVKSVNVDELTDDELVKLMDDFALQHSDALNVEVNSDNHIVKEITLEYGEDLVIESENYPSFYPNNRIVDWIITGKGVGIEFNVTDFAVNSAIGDYLMVKPGQTDASGREGLIFAYHLNEPRAYRFLDVDRLFLRFDAKNGFPQRGFRLTVSMIAPLPSEPEPEPEPEPILPEPHDTIAIYLGGVTLEEFRAIKEDFRLLVADMATMYINVNGIELGMNTTTEITQITSAYLCNIHWPGYEKCVLVRVAVPLVYEESEQEGRLSEQELEDMWNTYVATDPFAERLRQMGIESFSVPNDAGVLTVWLVVALGVLVSAVMLALALWRYSCFKDYSRMPAFSDTDSLNEKRGLDLYPTPHQTLPPLYSNEYKWDKFDDATKVDMGGFANRSYVRTDMYDMESDEEVAPRDRNAGIHPRDIYNV